MDIISNATNLSTVQYEICTIVPNINNYRQNVNDIFGKLQVQITNKIMMIGF